MGTSAPINTSLFYSSIDISVLSIPCILSTSWKIMKVDHITTNTHLTIVHTHQNKDFPYNIPQLSPGSYLQLCEIPGIQPAFSFGRPQGYIGQGLRRKDYVDPHDGVKDNCVPMSRYKVQNYCYRIFSIYTMLQVIFCFFTTFPSPTTHRKN